MKRIMLWSVISIAAVLLIAAIIPFMVDLNKYRDPILKQTYQYVNRKIDFQDIRLTVLSGIGAELRDFHIQDDPGFSSGDFASLARVQIKVALLPLLGGNIQVSKIIIKDPVINCIRSLAGVYNFKTLLKPQPEKEEKEKESGAAALQKFLIRHLEIRDGKFSYRDLRAQKADNHPIRIEKIDLDARDISVTKPVDFELKAALLDPSRQNFSLKGSLGPLKTGNADALASPMEMHAVLTQLPIAALVAKLPSLSSLSGTVDVTGSLAGKIEVKDAFAITLPPAPAAKGAPGNFVCNLTSVQFVEYQHERIEIASGSFKLGSDQGMFSGSVEKFKTQPAWKLNLSAPGIHPSAFMAALPGLLPAGLAPQLRLDGALSVDIKASGAAGISTIQTSADMSPMAINYKTLFAKPKGLPLRISSTTLMQKGLIDIPAWRVSLGQINATGKGRVDTGTDKPSYSFTMRTNTFDLAQAAHIIPLLGNYHTNGALALQGDMSGAADAMHLGGIATATTFGFALPQKSAQQASQLKPAILTAPPSGKFQDAKVVLRGAKQEKSMKIQGTMHARQGSLMSIPLRNLKAAFSYAPPQFSISSLSFDALQGNIKSTADFDSKTKKWKAQPQITAVQAGNILDLFVPSKGAFTGLLTTSAKLNGASGASALNSLSAAGSLALNNGQWRGMDLSATTLGKLMAIPGFAQITGVEQERITKVGATEFKNLNLGLRIGKGMLQIDGMKINNIHTGKDNDAAANLRGTFNLASRQLDLKGSFALPRRISGRLLKKTGALDNLQDENQRVILPLVIGGTLQKPSPSVDIHTIKNALAASLMNKAVDKGLQRLQEKTGIPAGSKQGKQVEQILKGLLKKQ